MIYRSYVPVPPLDGFVERFWHCSDAPSHRRERILPSGTFEIVIDLRQNEIRIYDQKGPDRCRRFSGAVVSGPYSGSFLVDPLQHASIIGVHFRPGGAFPFLGVGADELTDAHVDLEALWGGAASQLRDRLCAAGTSGERFAILENALLSRLKRTAQRHHAVSIALATFERTFGQASVADTARQLGLSERRFIQAFAAEVGLTPKLYCRIRRFQRAKELAFGLAMSDWARIAFDCGYYDQSHLIRDFNAFSGLSPGAYLRRASEDVLPNHVPQNE